MCDGIVKCKRLCAPKPTGSRRSYVDYRGLFFVSSPPVKLLAITLLLFSL